MIFRAHTYVGGGGRPKGKTGKSLVRDAPAKIRGTSRRLPGATLYSARFTASAHFITKRGPHPSSPQLTLTSTGPRSEERTTVVQARGPRRDDSERSSTPGVPPHSTTPGPIRGPRPCAHPYISDSMSTLTHTERERDLEWWSGVGVPTGSTIRSGGGVG